MAGAPEIRTINIVIDVPGHERDLLHHVEALASDSGFRRAFVGRDEATGDRYVIIFRPLSEDEAA